MRPPLWRARKLKSGAVWIPTSPVASCTRQDQAITSMRSQSPVTAARVDVDPARYATLEVLGRDPFTQKSEALAPAVALDRSAVVRVARSSTTLPKLL